MRNVSLSTRLYPIIQRSCDKHHHLVRDFLCKEFSGNSSSESPSFVTVVTISSVLFLHIFPHPILFAFIVIVDR